MAVGITGAIWDESAPGGPGLRIVGGTGTQVYNEADVPNNVQRTLAGYQTWLDGDLQKTLRSRGFPLFIRSKMISLTPFFFKYWIFDTQAAADAFVFPPF